MFQGTTPLEMLEPEHLTLPLPFWQTVETCETLKVDGFVPLDSLQRCLGRGFQQGLRILFWITISEHGVARHQNFCTRAHHIGNRVERNPAIYFDAVW